MRDHLEEYLRDPPPEVGGDYLDRLRAALQEMLKLSTESVQPAEAQVERRHQRATKEAQERFQNASREIEEQFGELKEKARREYEEQVGQVQTRFEADSNTLETDTRLTRERIADEAEAARRSAKRSLDQAAWLAESVAEATRDKLRKETEQMSSEVPAIAGRLESLRQQAQWLLQQYRQEPGVEPPADASACGTGDPVAAFREQYQSAQKSLAELGVLRIPRLFIGIRPHVLTILLCTASVGLMGSLTLLNVPHCPPFVLTGPLALLVSLLAALAAGKALRRLARSQVQVAYAPLIRALAAARKALEQRLQLAAKKLKQREAEAIEKRESEIRGAKQHYDSVTAEIERRRGAALEQVEEAYTRLRREVDTRRDLDLDRIEERQTQSPSGLRRYEQALAATRQRHERRMEDCRSRYESARAALERRWQAGLSRIQTLLEEAARLNCQAFLDFGDPSWQAWTPPDAFTSVVRFGQWQVDLGQLAGSVRAQASFATEGSPPASAPALLILPQRGSLLLQTDRAGRENAIEALRAVMTRLLTSLGPGRVHFTLIDPVGLGENFAGFMHLADYEEALIGSRIWTEPAHIEQRLTDLTNHMENVIQKYLRNEFETIDAYNAQAGELAEPYRFLVIADFPVNFNEESARRLSSIVSSGARCGVYTLIAHDRRQEMPPGIQIEDLEGGGVHLVYEGERFVWQDRVLRQFPLVLDKPPAEETLTRIMHAVGRGAKDSLRVEVPFETVVPPPGQDWAGDSSEELCVPVGRTGATRLQALELGRGVAQHTLIAGKTGSGKSTLLHVIITNLALWYSPDEIEFYLIDFKKGVEFKTYVTHELPHARAVAIESDREFGLSVLQRLDAEMQHRGDLFRGAGVQDLASYRQARRTRVPRTLLIVDEFQVFFAEDDKLAQDAAILLDRLVRQGRAFGIHVLLGSQTLGGTTGLARSTMGQMAVRIALQCSEADSQLILDDANVAARLLSRPGEAIYNDVGGLIEGNSPFQTAWLSDEHQDEYLDRISDLARARSDRPEPLIVFEGSAPADIGRNRPLAGLLDSEDWPPSPAAPRVWLGEAVAIKDPTAVTFRRQSGANLMIVGQRDDTALALMTAAMLSLAAQHDPESARFFVLDGTPGDSPLAGELQRIASALPHSVRMVEWRDVAETMAELADEAQRRQDADRTNAVACYLLIYSLQRYRMLRRRDDDFSFSADDADKAPSPDKQFVELLREGPPVGVHTLLWADTPAALERTLDRQTLGEFDNRVLFQMSAADSSNLIDSPAANRLGFYRALLFSEEQGWIERFRPYALLDPDWLKQAASRLNRK